MPSLKRNRFLILAVTLSVLLTAPAAAINLQAPDNNRIWMNDGASSQQFQAKCSTGFNRKIYLNSTEGGENHTIRLSDSENSLQKNDFTGISLGNYNLNLQCLNKTSDGSVEEWRNTSAEVTLRELGLAVKASGKGFVDGKLTESLYEENSRPMELEVDFMSGAVEESFFANRDATNFRFEGTLSLQNSDVEISGSDPVKVTLTPEVGSNYFRADNRLKILDENGDTILSRSVNSDIHEWKADLVGGSNPSRRMSFENVLNGDYSYLLNVQKVSDSDQPILYDENFVLTVMVKDGTSYEVVDDDLKGVSQKIEDKQWLKWSEPSGQVGNYRVTLDSIKELKNLPDRQYKFLLEFERNPEKYNVTDEFVIDQVLVDKESMFSGKVVGTQGAGVETLMKLRSPDRNVRIKTGKDGFYSREINSNSFDSMVLDFFKRGKLSPDGSVVVSGPELGEKSDLGRGGSAVKFDYWSDPGVDITGVDSVNMMAVKFGYPINSFDSANVKFNPSGINPENLQVYECSFWNFEGKECLGSWERLDENSFSVNMGISPPDVHISELEPYTTPDDNGQTQDILMNAYVLGTSADIRMRDPVSIDGPVNARIPKGDSIKFTGFVETQKGNLVSSGIPVEVTLESPEDSETYSGETNVNGKFVVQGDAPEETGNYSVSVSADPQVYSGFSVRYSKPLSVYTSKQVSLDVPETFTMQKGEEKTMSFQVENTGQAELQIEELVADGLSTDFFSWVNKVSGEIPAGESKTAEIRFDIPEAYSDSYPSIGLKVEAVSQGETLEDSTTAQIRARNTLTDSQQQEGEQENTTGFESSQNQSNTTTDSSNTGPGQQITRVTGNFIQSTSNINLALGLIMVLMMIVAGAVRKKKDDRGSRRGDSRRGGNRGRPQIGKMNVSPQTKETQETGEKEQDSGGPEEAEDENIEEDQTSQEKDAEQEESDEKESEEDEKFVDEETGKEFDTKEALELFQEMND